MQRRVESFTDLLLPSLFRSNRKSPWSSDTSLPSRPDSSSPTRKHHLFARDARLQADLPPSSSLARSRSWRLSLALSAILPCIACTGAFMGIFTTKYKAAALGHVAESGSLAEEVISSIRTAQGQSRLHSLSSSLLLSSTAEPRFFFFSFSFLYPEENLCSV